MPRPRRTARQKLLSETRQRLLEAAAVEFARQGYAAANVNRISQAAGFAKGTIYNYFPSKRALMLALIDDIAAEHGDVVLRQMETEEDPTGQLRLFYEAGFSFADERPEQTRVVINAVYGPDEEFVERVYQAYGELLQFITDKVFGAGVARGDFRPVDPELATAMIMSVYLGGCSQRDADGQIWLDPEQVASLVLAGLRAPGRGSDREG